MLKLMLILFGDQKIWSLENIRPRLSVSPVSAVVCQITPFLLFAAYLFIHLFILYIFLDDNFLSGVVLCPSNAGNLFKKQFISQSTAENYRNAKAIQFLTFIVRHSVPRHVPVFAPPPLEASFCCSADRLEMKEPGQTHVYFAVTSLLLLPLLFILPLLDSSDHRQEK